MSGHRLRRTEARPRRTSDDLRTGTPSTWGRGTAAEVPDA